MRKRLLPVLVVGVVFALTACQSQPAAPQGTSSTSPAGTQTTQSAAAAPVATPESGKATVVGSVQSKKTGATVKKNVVVWLAEVFRNDKGDIAYALDPAHSPAPNTDDNGAFVAPNVDAKEYVIVVGDPYGQHEVITGDPGKARVWTTAPGKVLDVGVLQIDF